MPRLFRPGKMKNSRCIKSFIRQLRCRHVENRRKVVDAVGEIQIQDDLIPRPLIYHRNVHESVVHIPGDKLRSDSKNPGVEASLVPQLEPHTRLEPTGTEGSRRIEKLPDISHDHDISVEIHKAIVSKQLEHRKTCCRNIVPLSAPVDFCLRVGPFVDLMKYDSFAE